MCIRDRIYPHKFCIAYAKVLASLLGSLFDNRRRRDEASWFSTMEDEPYFDDYDQYQFIDDILELAETTVYEDEALAVVCEGAGEGLTQGIEGSCLLGLTEISSPTRELRTLMSWADSFPREAEIEMTKPQSAQAERLVPYAQAIRRYYLPTHRFQKCWILRGAIGPELEEDAWAFLWKKGSKRADLIFVGQYDWKDFDYRPWTMLVFCLLYTSDAADE